MNRKPNFYVVGAAKSGTTTIHSYLSRHPDIFLPEFKEPHYFARNHEFNFDVIKDKQKYYQLFQGRSEKAIGEASTAYLHYSDIPELIHSETPNAKIIIILRHPTERALSMWGHQIREGLEKCTLELAIDQELNEGTRYNGSVDFGFNYLAQGFMSKNIAKYQSVFGTKNVFLCDYNDLRNKPKELIAKICVFLGLDTMDLTQDLGIQNASGKPRSQILHAFLNSKHPIRKGLVWPLKLLLTSEQRHKIWARVRNNNILNGRKHTLLSVTKDRLDAIFAQEITFYESIKNDD